MLVIVIVLILIIVIVLVEVSIRITTAGGRVVIAVTIFLTVTFQKRSDYWHLFYNSECKWKHITEQVEKTESFQYNS